MRLSTNPQNTKFNSEIGFHISESGHQNEVISHVISVNGKVQQENRVVTNKQIPKTSSTVIISQGNFGLDQTNQGGTQAVQNTNEQLSIFLSQQTTNKLEEQLTNVIETLYSKGVKRLEYDMKSSNSDGSALVQKIVETEVNDYLHSIKSHNIDNVIQQYVRINTENLQIFLEQNRELSQTITIQNYIKLILQGLISRYSFVTHDIEQFEEQLIRIVTNLCTQSHKATYGSLIMSSTTSILETLMSLARKILYQMYISYYNSNVGHDTNLVIKKNPYLERRMTR